MTAIAASLRWRGAGLPVAVALSTLASCSRNDFCAAGTYGCIPASAGKAGVSGSAGHNEIAGSGNGLMGDGGQSGASNGSDSIADAGATSAQGGTHGAAAQDNNSGEGGIGDAGTGGASKCDAGLSPHDEPCLVADDYAIFVAPRGNDAGTGQKTDPLRTLSRALSLYYATGKVIIACSTEGSLTEQVNVNSSFDGVRIYGGFDCRTWQPVGTKTVVASTQSTTLRIDGLTHGVTIEDFAFQAPDAKTAGGSSVGAFITSSSGVQFTRVSITAGKGMAGANGAGTTMPAATGASGNGGYDECTAMTQPNSGAPAVQTQCDGRANGSIGGKGGDGGNDDGSAGNGDDGAPQGGLGGSGYTGNGSWQCDVTSTGQAGAPGQSKNSAPGATSIGTLSANGFVGSPGTDGESGTPGTGGGGGGGNKAPASCEGRPRTGAAGGSGGGGGCGGKGGMAGEAGGSSIALAVLDSTVTLTNVELVASDAGKGGDGGFGQPGGAAGNPGHGGSGGGCSGGPGGKGGDGGSGGGAAGGISVGIVWSGVSAPAQTHVTFAEGAPGAKGLGGSVGMNDGIDGIARDVWNVM